MKHLLTFALDHWQFFAGVGLIIILIGVDHFLFFQDQQNKR